MNREATTKYRSTGRRRVIARKVDMDNYTYTLVSEAGAVVDTFRLNFCTESGGVWTMDAEHNMHYHAASDRKGDLVGNLRNWEAGGAYPE